MRANSDVDFPLPPSPFPHEYGGRRCFATASRCYTGTFPPCGDEQNIVVERFNAAALLIAALRIQLTAARCVKKSLLQNLLTGKIRLKP